MGGYFIIMIAFGTLIYKTLKKEMKMRHEKEALAYQLEAGKAIESHAASTIQTYEEMRAFRHDYHNMMWGLSEFIRRKDLAGIEAYFSETMGDFQMQVDEDYHGLESLNFIEDEILKGLLLVKLMKAQKFGIKVEFECLLPVGKIPLKPLHLSRILGILLDNAIEAAIMTKQPLIRVAVIKQKSFYEVLIQNNFEEKPDLMRIMEHGYSSKGEGRGLGLYNLMELEKKLDNLMFTYEIKADLFTGSLKIYNDLEML
jgi:two-component system sensor histidine kinase AgrC